MNIYLVANNKDIDIKWIKKMNNLIKIKENDLIIRINKGLLLNLFNGKTTHFYFRSSENWFQGVKSNGLIKNKYIYNNRNNINFGIISNINNLIKKKIEIIESKNNIKFNSIIPILTTLKNIINKSPSSGLVALIYFMNKYPKAQIYLMGFNFYNGIVNWHNFSNEIKFVNKLIKKSKRIHVLN